jgi:hypothetical protein
MDKITPSELLSGIEPMPVLLTPSEAAKFLRNDIQTLAKWRSEKRKSRKRSSLPFVKNGDGKNARVLYRLSDLKKFIEARVHVPGEAKPKGKRRRTA